MLTSRCLSILLVAVCSSAGVFGRSHRNRKAADEFVKQITYTGEEDLNQKVTIKDEEAMFEVTNGVNAVIDYEQELFIFKNEGKCHVADFNISWVPTILEIKQLIETETSFVRPLNNIQLEFKADQELPPLDLLPLATLLCKETTETVRGEMVENKDGRVKRKVGVGEVIVIIIALILLGFLG